MKLCCTLLLYLEGTLTRRGNEVWWYTPQEIKRHLIVVPTIIADGVVLPALANFKGLGFLSEHKRKPGCTKP